MRITLTPEQEAWIKARFEIADEASVEAVARRILDERIAEEEDDLAWAKPLVDEGLAQLERGEVFTLEEHKARMAARLAEMKR
jgi:antitoxin ParD1/3/4